MNPSVRLGISIVVYKHSYQMLEPLIHAVLALPNEIKLYLIDNSPTPILNENLPSDIRIVYTHPGKNLGYGRGHNLALHESMLWADYHLVLNPDILVQTENLSKMLTYLEQHPNIGLLMPKVLYGNGEIQYLNKLFPTPFDLIMRRFIPSFLQSSLQKRMNRYELKHKDYNQTMEVPNLSGCFMLLRIEVLRIVGVFDEHFFMYLEDTDLSRRINMQFQTMYYPEVSIIHQYEKGSYKNLRLLKYHIVSAFRYFNKYGWFFDTVRTTINRRYI